MKRANNLLSRSYRRDEREARASLYVFRAIVIVTMQQESILFRTPERTVRPYG
jgi:hypothetical protein